MTSPARFWISDLGLWIGGFSRKSTIGNPKSGWGSACDGGAEFKRFTAPLESRRLEQSSQSLRGQGKG